jgi:beta-mannosidase
LLDVLAGADWECAFTTPGALGEPKELANAELSWVSATVPGTGAGALRDAGLDYLPAYAMPDDYDWWFRCPIPTGAGDYLLSCEGLATVADAWIGDEHVLHSEAMFTPLEAIVSLDGGGTELVFRFAALTPLLAKRYPRAAWKTRLMRVPALRWWRTSLFGRMPGTSKDAAPVGIWRPITLTSVPALRVTSRQVTTRLEGTEGVVQLRLEMVGADSPAEVTVGEITAQAELVGGLLEATVRLADAERWWPAGYGAQPLYPVTVRVEQHEIPLGRIGFRDIAVDTAGDGWTLHVNGTRIFARGALWNPPDVVSLQAEPERLRRLLTLARDGGLVMLRIPGTSVYPDEAFLDLCDELGLLVWQDLMVANLPPPDDDGFRQTLEGELRAVFGRMAGRASTAVICGGSEVEQQAAMMGLGAERIAAALPVLTRDVPALVEQLLPGTPYVVSSPTGGEPPFRPDAGITHWFGVGAYLRPLEDARRAGVRFASECLAFSNPPESGTVEEFFGGAHVAGHLPSWKAAVPRDSGTPWDFEDVRHHYVSELYGVDPQRLRFTDPDRVLDLGRAAVAEAISATLAEWRRPGSTCAGGLILSFNDAVPGAGWGLVDAVDRPKSVWYAVRRVSAPIAVLISDEGLGGLAVHVINDGEHALEATLAVSLFSSGEVPVGSESREITVAPHGSFSVDAEQLLGGFRDVSWSYRFGPVPHDVVVATLRAADGTLLSEAVHLPAGGGRPVESDLGLAATLIGDADTGWAAQVSTRRFAQSVHLNVAGWRPVDSWFDLPPGQSRLIALVPESPSTTGQPHGDVAALNAERPVAISSI